MEVAGKAVKAIEDDAEGMALDALPELIDQLEDHPQPRFHLIHAEKILGRPGENILQSLKRGDYRSSRSATKATPPHTSCHP